jgi:hypothetical protein
MEGALLVLREMSLWEGVGDNKKCRSEYKRDDNANGTIDLNNK